MKANTFPICVTLLVCLAVLALMVLSVGLCLAGQEHSAGYWGGLGASDVPDGISGRIIQNNDYDIAVGPGGTPHVVWASPLQDGPTATPSSIIKYAFWDGSNWRGLPEADGPTDLGIGEKCSITVLPSGWPVVLFCALDALTSKTVLQVFSWSGSGWQTIFSPELNRVETGAFRVAVDGLSRLHILYIKLITDLDGKTHRYLYYSIFDGESLHGLAGSDEGEGMAGDCENIIDTTRFDLALDNRAFPHVVWQGDAQQVFYKFWDGEAWQQVDGQEIFPELDFTTQPRIVVDNEGHPHITVIGGIVTGPDTYTEHMCYATWDGSSWKTTHTSSTLPFRDMTTDSAGNLNLCWTPGPVNSIYFRRWDGAGFSTLAWGDVGWGVSPPPPFLGPDAKQWYEASRIAVGPTDEIYVAYMAITNIPVAGTPSYEAFGSCRVSKFMQEPAPYPLLRIETDRYRYDPGATTMTIMLGADNQQDQWVDTKLFLAAYRKEDDELYQFSLPLSLPPHFYFPLSAVFELPIGEAELFRPSGSSYLLGAQFLDATTGDALGPLRWKRITINL
ncbi:MAG TPA: hypothetical protein VM163_02870 [bacterium]|nr:hypothetical protein [bacterium]